MPYVKIDPEIYLTHNDVDVFCTYGDGFDSASSYWFTTKPETADECNGHGQNGHFDVRMFVRRWESTPTVAQWEDWWRPRFKTEDEAIEALIKTEIEAGRIIVPVSAVTERNDG
jgi:hypothetical protein